MKIDRLDAHDRFLSFQKKSFEIPDCAQDLINQKPFGPHGFYLFCHPRTDDDGLRKRYIWQPRLLKPKAQTNSALYKTYPGSDIIKIMWMIPPREMWNVFQLGNLCENETILQSIWLFENDRERLEKPEEDDLTPKKAQEVLFEYQPQLFRRDTLPAELRGEWDRRMAERDRLKSKPPTD